MKDEILQKAYATDAARIPRYRLVDKEGKVLLDGVEIQLLNQIEQAGTPYSKEAVLPDDLAEEMCPEVADPTPADALRAINTKAVQVVPQQFDEDEKAQARSNIGVNPEVWTFTLVDETTVTKVVYVG